MKESFGSDGQPACHADIDLCDALLLFGHNMAATQTVMWTRVLDRLAGPNRPRVVVVDPRRTPVAEMADVHLAPLLGSNQRWRRPAARLQDLCALASFTDITWTVVGQAAQGLRDEELIEVVSSCEQDTARQLAWLKTRIKQSAPQALIAARG